MLTLTLDTATSMCTVAVGKNRKVLAEKNIMASQSHMEKLLPLINEMLSEAGFSAKSLGAIVVGLGPGSFTGVRIGVATAKGLAQALRCSLYGISSLDCLAYGVKEDGFIASVIDAKRGEIYFSFYRKENKKLTRMADYMCLDPYDFCQRLLSFKDNFQADKVIIAGDALFTYRDVIEKECGKNCKVEDSKRWYPRASCLFYLANAYNLVKEKQKYEDGLRLSPIYIRGPVTKR